jgi:acyl dehydratase
LVVVISCKPQPELNILVEASFKTIPNKTKILLGDTLRVYTEVDDKFISSSGGYVNNSKWSIINWYNACRV